MNKPFENIFDLLKKKRVAVSFIQVCIYLITVSSAVVMEINANLVRSTEEVSWVLGVGSPIIMKP